MNDGTQAVDDPTQLVVDEEVREIQENQKVAAKLVKVSGGPSVTDISITAVLTIGRKNADVVIADKRVSSTQHNYSKVLSLRETASPRPASQFPRGAKKLHSQPASF